MTARRSDLAIFGVYTAVSLILGYLSLESSLTTPAWALAALFLAGTVAIFTSRRHPRGASVAVLLLLPLSFAALPHPVTASAATRASASTPKSRLIAGLHICSVE